MFFNAGSDRENIRQENEVLSCERELFLEEIKQSQRDIHEFREKIEQLIGEKDAIQRENEELSQLLDGEQARCGKLDREVMELINTNQDLKV